MELNTITGDEKLRQLQLTDEFCGCSVEKGFWLESQSFLNEGRYTRLRGICKNSRCKSVVTKTLPFELRQPV